MGKPFRSKRSSDSEQLLAPRKNGLFGKRNIGVRSEDPEKPKAMSARRLVSSVFNKNSKRPEDELSPIDDSPVITLGQFANQKSFTTGSPKTTPPSPDLVVLTKNNSTMKSNSAPTDYNSNPYRGVNVADDGEMTLAGEETVMSDLTGTISPTPQVPQSANKARPAQQQTHGVTFGQESYYSAYSPSLGMFQSDSRTENEILAASTMGAHSPSPEGDKPVKDFCKTSVFDQVFGVVDGACHRSMDLTLIGLTGGKNHCNSNSAASDAGTSTPAVAQWGVAPSDDEDESTCLDTVTQGDTMGGTLTRDTYTMTTADNTRSGRDARTRDTGLTPSMQEATKTSETTNASKRTAPSEEASNRIGNPSEKSTEVAGHLSLSSTQTDLVDDEPHTKPVPLSRREPSEFHENFELVLGQISYTPEEAPEEQSISKKRSTWGSKLLKSTKHVHDEEKKEDKADISLFEKQAVETKVELQQMQGKPQAASTQASRPTTPVTKERQASSPVLTPKATETSSTPLSPGNEMDRETLFKSVFGDDFRSSPSSDVGIEIQSRRVVQQQEERTAASEPRGKPPRSPSKKGLTSLVKRLRFSGKIRRTKSTSSVVQSSIPLAALSSKRPFKASSNAPPTKKDAKRVASPLPPTVSSKAAKPKKNSAEEEKTEIEPVSAIEHKAQLKTLSEFSTSEKESEKKKFSGNLEIAELSCQPCLPLDKSSSCKLSGSKVGAEASPIPASKTMDDDIKLTETVPINRLRSAPVRLSTSSDRKDDSNFIQDSNIKESDDECISKEARKPLEQLRKTAPKLTWKAANDAQGRTYYYHRETRKTTWTKPDEFDQELAAVKKYKEELEAAKQEASETQQVIDGCKTVEAIQASLRSKKNLGELDPEVWKIKEEILDIVETMPLPKETDIEKLLIQYEGRESQLLANLKDLVESKPFDEPFQAPRKPEIQLENEQLAESNLNISHASSSVSSQTHLQTVDVQHRVRTAVSASTRISEKTYLTEQTEKIRNTSDKTSIMNSIATIREVRGGVSTGSLSSGSGSIPPRLEKYSFNDKSRVPSRIPAVPRSRDLKVEEFSNDRIAKETYNGDVVIGSAVPEKSKSDANADLPPSRGPDLGQRNAKAVAEQIVALSSLDDDDSSYHGDFEETVDERATDTGSERNPDSISALSDGDYQAQKGNFERARRRALDRAVEQEDWDLAASLSQGMKQVKDSLYGDKDSQKEWTQTELDRFISENDWDAVSKYIAHMRENSAAVSASASSRGTPSMTTQRGRDPGTGVDPDGLTPSNKKPAANRPPPSYMSEATKRASTHTQSGRKKQQQLLSAANSVDSSQGSSKPAQTRFGARSQLQHNELTSISSWDNSSSSYDSEYSDNSYESDDEHGYISLRVRRNEFEC